MFSTVYAEFTPVIKRNTKSATGVLPAGVRHQERALEGAGNVTGRASAYWMDTEGVLQDVLEGLLEGAHNENRRKGTGGKVEGVLDEAQEEILKG